MKREKSLTIQKSYDPLEVGLPSALWIENLMLGIAMVHQRMPEMVSMLNVDDFSTEANRLIWMACASLNDKNIPLSGHVVATELREFGQLQTVGGITYIAELLKVIPNLPDLKKWASILRDFAQRRKLIIKSNELLIEASQPNCDIGALLTDGADILTRYGSELTPDAHFKSPKEILSDFGGLNSYGANPSPDRIIATPFPSVNRYLQMGGFVGGDLVVLAGHTSRGKSALAVNMALDAVYKGKRVALISLEMGEGAIFDRMVSLCGKLDGYTLHRENQNQSIERERRWKIREAVNEVVNLPISISYRPGVNPKKLLADLKRFKAVNGLDFVVIDYLQLMSAGNERQSINRAEEVGNISRSLKRIAGELDVPVLALSQFSRESAKQEREPELHDLRESGSIEHDASIVFLMHVTRTWDMAAGIDTGEVKLKIAKQRNGSTTWCMLRFHAPTGKFSEPDTPSYER